MATLFFLITGAAARASDFDEVEVEGHCRQAGTHILESGNTLSVLFDDFGAFMPQGEQGDGLQVQKRCQFRVRFNFPRDKYLAGLRQVFSGGVIKSKKSGGRLEIEYQLGAKSAQKYPIPMKWAGNQAIPPESADSVFTHITEDALPMPANCRGTARYRIKMVLGAHRQSTNEFFIGGLDSYDAELVQRLDLIPIWKPCTPPRNR